MSDFEFIPGDLQPPVKCIGLMGHIFGHKFVKRGWTSTGACFRCGTLQGAWTK